MHKLIAGTRRSRLARIQTRIITDRLNALFPDVTIEEKIIVTKGDQILDYPLSKIDDKGLFTREIEDNLLNGSIDFAVHSLKDLPTELPEGLMIAAVYERESTDDVLISKSGITLETLPSNARVGTSSLRRKAQVLHIAPSLATTDIRGNVNTRIEKLERGEYDAIILAKAGIIRLGLEDKISSVLDPENWFYAVGQGAIAVEIRKDDNRVGEIISRLNHFETQCVTDAERSFLGTLGGGCQIPVGVQSVIEGDKIKLRGMVSGENGDPYITGEIEGSILNPIELGKAFAESLIEKGADKVLETIRGKGL